MDDEWITGRRYVNPDLWSQQNNESDDERLPITQKAG